MTIEQMKQRYNELLRLTPAEITLAQWIEKKNLQRELDKCGFSFEKHGKP